MRYCFYIACISSIMLFYSCHDETKPVNKEDAKKEIADAEKAFEKMAAEKGIAEAFWFYADSNAVIKRQNDTLIRGKDNIRNYYTGDFFNNASVTWSPAFIEVAANGDLGYTFGRYTWATKDSSGKVEEYKGVFHTVWKKQTDGSWKYVWD